MATVVVFFSFVVDVHVKGHLVAFFSIKLIDENEVWILDVLQKTSFCR
jgi:hypothetical protein